MSVEPAAPTASVVPAAAAETAVAVETDAPSGAEPDTALVDPKPAARPKRRQATTDKARTSGGAAKGDRASGERRASGTPSERRSTEPRRGRRRFSLPPLDEDHERVSRSIGAFLGGIEPGPDDAAAAGSTAPPAGATTVAVVAIDGLPDLAPGEPAASRGTVDDALAMVERTLRGAARGSDVVTILDRGCYRVVLASTGELAARAYLRRIRAAIEPRLEASDLPLRLAVATATVLDEPVEDAVERAEHRLSMALAAARSSRIAARADEGDEGQDDDEVRPPRAAAD
jgi:hypothetical protein